MSDGGHTQLFDDSLLERAMDVPMTEVGNQTHHQHQPKTEIPPDGEEKYRPASVHPTELLRFSIENILLPGFGSNERRQATSQQHVQRCEPLDFANKFSTTIPTTSAVVSREVAAKVCPQLPAWIFCTRYSDRPSSGPRTRKQRKKSASHSRTHDEEEKRPRTAFTTEQLKRLREQFVNSRYLTEKRRQELAHELGLNESQVKIWFQNKRAKLKKSSTQRHNYASQALQLMSQAFYSGIENCRQSLKE